MATPPKKDSPAASVQKSKTAQSAPAPAKKGAAPSKAPFMDPGVKKDALETVRLRNDFYRDNYRRLIAVLLMLLVLMFAMAYWIYYLTSHRPSPRYFATNAAGGLIPLKPLSVSSISNIALQNWSVRAATTAFTFNYIQLNQQLEMAKDIYFTGSGGDAFINSLIKSGDLDAVTQGKFIVTSQPTGAPEILSHGIMGKGTYKGRYAWVVRVPLEINYESVLQNITSRRDINVQMTVVRTSPLVDNAAINIDSMQGIGISQMLVQGVSNTPTAPQTASSTSSMATPASVDEDEMVSHPAISVAI